MKTCPACGAPVEETARACSSCGYLLAPGSLPPEPVNTQQPFEPPQPPRYQQYPQGPYGYMSQPAKSRSTALLLEILPGLFGFLGIGWIYAGNTSRGVATLVGYLVWIIIGGTIIALTAGIGTICILPVSIAGVVLSAMQLDKYTKQHPELFA